MNGRFLSGILKCMISAFLAVCVSTSLTACGDDGGNGPGGEAPDEPGNRALEGTKWTDRNFDYDVADDMSWAYSFTEVTSVYFYSNTEGVFYYSRKTDDSDTGHSRHTQVCFFTYHVKGSYVELEPITDKLSGFEYSLQLKDGSLVYSGEAMKKGSITSGDRSWLNEISGTTGSCRWYYDMRATLTVTGSGAIPDYSSYNATPWERNGITYNILKIGGDVTKAGACAFACRSLGEVEFKGKKITEIGAGAFKGACIGKLYLPDNIRTIGADAFSGCRYAEIWLPSKIEEIGASAFSDCKSVNMSNTPGLRKIGDMALAGTDISRWTDSKVLESIGTGAVYLDQSSISLPAIKELGSIAVSGTGLKEIHIGNALVKVTGSPFAGAATGKLYINQGSPLSLQSNIIAENVGKWTLYVPKGSESAYKNAAYWKNFKSVVGSSDLDDVGGGSGGGSDADELVDHLSVTPRAFTATVAGSFTSQAYASCKSFEIRYGTAYGLSTYKTKQLTGLDFNVVLDYLEASTEYYYMIVATDNNRVISGDIKSFTTKSPQAPSSCTYSIDGKTFRMVKVTGLGSGDFYIMQTELPIAASFKLGNCSPGKLDKNLDNIIIKAEFREFMETLRNTTDIDFRLPTSAEWMYAAKGGQYSKGYTYAGGNSLDEVGWYKNNSGNVSHIPAKLSPNELGLYDMSGNYGEVVHTSGDRYDVDGNVYGGWYSCIAKNCTVTSYITQPTGKVEGSTKSEKNAFNGRYYTVRLVYSAQ